MYSFFYSGDHILWKTDPMYKITVTQAVPTVIFVPKTVAMRMRKAKPKLTCTKWGYIRLGLVLAQIKKTKKWQ